jgi:predicted metal-dependent phosphoesterase TrpH
MINADLHCHSTISDGELTPEAVAARAKAGGVELWALTDHDEIDGIARARAAADALGMPFVAGVEISVTWANQTVHIVGLRVDEHEPSLRAGLAATRGGREARARQIAADLARAGIPDAYEGALRYVGNPELISRTHFARHLVDAGVCDDVNAVFRNYLTEGKPGFFPHQWARLGDAVGWIRGAGGVAVIAHPGRYKYTDMQFGALFDEFKQLGGEGIEVVTGSHTPDQYPEYARVARHYGFLASRGSDFHSPRESRVDLGSLPPLPDGLTPVWHDWL